MKNNCNIDTNLKNQTKKCLSILLNINKYFKHHINIYEFKWNASIEIER